MAKLVDFVFQHLILALFLGYFAIGVIFRHSLFGAHAEPVKPAQTTPPAVSATQQKNNAPAAGDDASQPRPDQANYQFRPMPAPQVADPSPTAKFEALLDLARTAVKNGDDENAVGYYQSAIRTVNDRPEPFGELGNLYLKAGDMEQAAAAYYEAGVRIPHDSQRLQGLMRVLEKISPDTAKREGV